MGWIKKIAGWPVALVLWLWAVLPKALDWVGRSTLPEDWDQLMSEKLPVWSAWLFSTPWWVPASLASLLTAWMMWVSSPKAMGIPAALPAEMRPQAEVLPAQDFRIDPWADAKTETFVEIAIDPTNWRAKWDVRSNIFDVSVSLVDEQKGICEIVVVFDRWVASHRVSIQCDNKQQPYRTAIKTRTDRYAMASVEGCAFPCTIRMEF